MTRASSGHLLRNLVPMTGFRASRFCLNGSIDDCRLPSKPRWSQYVEWQGKRYRPGDHDADRDFVLLAVLAHGNRDRATEMVRDVRRRSVRGRIDEPVRDLDGDDYRLGRRGQGTVRSVRSNGWSGVVSVARVRLLHHGRAPVRGIVQTDIALRRGRFGVQVIGWMARRPGEVDPAVRLAALTEHVLVGLGPTSRSTIKLTSPGVTAQDPRVIDTQLSEHLPVGVVLALP